MEPHKYLLRKRESERYREQRDREKEEPFLKIYTIYLKNGLFLAKI